MRRLFLPALFLHALGWAAHGRRHAIQPHDGDTGRARASRGWRRAGRRAVASLRLSAAGAGALEIPVAVSLVDLDTNGDGLVDVREFIAMPRELLEDPKRFDTFRQRIVDFRHELFAMAEVDGDGVLNPRELDFAGYLLEEATFPLPDVPKHEEGDPPVYFEFGKLRAEENIRQHDLNSDGKIDRDEYVEGMWKFAMYYGWKDGFEDPKLVNWMQVAWATADSTGDDALNTAEVHYLAALIDRAANAGIFEDWRLASQVFSSLDASGDGRIDEAEVAKRMADVNDSVEGLLERMRGSEEGAPQGVGDGDLPPDADKEAEQLAVLSSYQGKKLLTEIHENFADADADGDGGLDVGEVRVLAERVIEAPVTI